MKRLLLCVVLLLVLRITSNAQQAKAFSFQWKVNTEKENPPLFQLDNSPHFFLMGNVAPVSLLSSPLQLIKYTLPKGAIFCRMEDALYKHFNVLIKVRMGTDDRYSN